ncbi:Calcium-dependent protein kinase 17 [Datura stramonium]|uniref:Calcium-dependent protein kinase 17 n=1 Tax=Datura stramonium TaxID=4076 RepID=A0ABS8T1U2_DATST|nr:Calcium-dependent protein kinase 17 [Datura stramonium]
MGNSNDEDHPTEESNTKNGDHNNESSANNSKKQQGSVTPPKSPDPSSKPSKKFYRASFRGGQWKMLGNIFHRTIVQIVHTCHSMGVIHRDLKPENFLTFNKDEDSLSRLLILDAFKDIVGSITLHLEVLKRRYGPEVDIWSVGVMLKLNMEYSMHIMDMLISHVSMAFNFPWCQRHCEEDVEFRSQAEADADGNGTIDYEEFITATMHMNRMDKDEHLYTAFKYFDKDNSGFITVEELEQAFLRIWYGRCKGYKGNCYEGFNNDGRINYDEFAAMMRKATQIQQEIKRNEGDICCCINIHC